MPQATYISLGVMSGTSLDGLDLALCQFYQEDKDWQYQILKTETIAYSKDWQERLANTEKDSALNYVKTDWSLGRYIGKKINIFLQDTNIQPQFIASHGHTIFHQPDRENGFTAQIGNGAAIAATSKLPVINDFRVADVAFGGQGAPLVPIGDHFLFSEYQFCLNLGGIANISTEQKGIRQAYDICACNMALNYIAQLAGLEYDKGGTLAASGTLIPQLLQELNNLSFFKIKGPKSLGKEWFLAEVLPVLESYHADPKDIAHTFVKHIASQIANTCQEFKHQDTDSRKMLVTGGGAYHQYLIQCIQNEIPWLKVVVPKREILEFKEALIFAFLGVLKWTAQVNCLASVTGASKDTIGGVLHQAT